MSKIRGYFLVALLVLFFLVILAFGFNYSKAQNPFGVTPLAFEKVKEVISDKKEVSVLSERLLVDGEAVAYDQDGKMFYIPQTLGSDKWQGRLSLRDKKTSEKLYIIAPELKKKEAMAKDIHYQICYVDDDNLVYQLSEIVLTGLPVLNITENEMLLFSTKDDNFIIDKSDIRYEQRGASTYYYEKKSYNLKLQDEKKSLLGLRTDDDWILNALYDDIGMIHNQLSYQVWNRIASQEEIKGNYCVNQEYVEVLMDGEYLGVYALSEREDNKQLMMSNDDILFKVTGYPHREGIGVIVLKNPKETTLESDSLKNAIMDHFGDFNDNPIENSLVLIDYENALDYSLFCQLATASDNVIKNSFFVGRRTGDFYKVSEVPWDCNITWGISSYVRTNEERVYDTEFKSMPIRVLERKDSEKINTDLANRWFSLRQEAITKENLFSILDENFTVLHDSGAYDRNYTKWPTVSVNIGDNGSISQISRSDIWEGESMFSAPVFDLWDDDSIYKFVEKRLEILDEYYKQIIEDSE